MADDAAAGETDLARLLATLDPALDPTPYVFATIAPERRAAVDALQPLGLFREDEGLSVIVAAARAAELGAADAPRFRRVTLRVWSSLEAVGLTAAVATALAEIGVSANVVAATRHDHVFVPEADAERALDALRALQRAS